MIPMIRSAIRDVNPNLPVFDAAPMADVVGVGLLPYRLAASCVCCPARSSRR